MFKIHGWKKLEKGEKRGNFKERSESARGGGSSTAASGEKGRKEEECLGGPDLGKALGTGL